MKNLIAIGVFLASISSTWAKTSTISCVMQEFSLGKNRSVNILNQRTNIILNQENNTLKIESTSEKFAFTNSKGNKIAKLEITNIDCDLPSIAEGIFWCRFIGYNHNSLPLSKISAHFFNGDVLKGVVGGYIEGRKITDEGAGGNGRIVTSISQRINMTLVDQSNYFMDYFALFYGNNYPPSCTNPPSAL